MCSFNAELSDPLYRSEEFMMFCYKILPCKKTFRHDWRVCPFAHGDETAKRRDPRIFKYTGVICPDAKKGRSCPRGDDCPCTHSLFEYWLHPTRFKTEICSRGSRCNRPFCFFAHKQTEIRKPNFRIQLQGITCEQTHDHPLSLSTRTNTQLSGRRLQSTSSCASTSSSMKRAPGLDPVPSPLFPPAAVSSLSLDGSIISLPESGSPNCDAELSAAKWNSLMVNDSPRQGSRMKPVTSTNLGFQSAGHGVIPSTSVCPLLPQIPTSCEHSGVDWSIWQPGAVSKQQQQQQQGGVPSSLPMGHEGTWNRRKLGAPVGLSPRLMETQNVARSQKETTASKTIDSGYDRDYLLATIRDVYQSMLSGCCSDQQQQGMMTTTSERRAEPPQRHASFGLTGVVGSSCFGSNGTCGLEGLQQQTGCASPNGLTYSPSNDPNSLERVMCALLNADSNMASRYFQ